MALGCRLVLCGGKLRRGFGYGRMSEMTNRRKSE